MFELETLEFKLFGFDIAITEGVVIQWILIALITIVVLLLTSNLKKIPDKKQSALEMLIETINGLVRDNMGESFRDLTPYVGTLLIFLLAMNLTPLFGIEAPTKELGATAGLAIISFFIIQAYAIKKAGLKGYLKGYLSPMPAILPMNILEKLVLPVSLSLRLFGNMLAGAVILDLVYSKLGYFAIGIPVPVHFYFDLFDGGLQMFIFAMLTMVNIKVVLEHSEH
jgi:F-type H+-transporting ATPase subunit a